VVAIFQTQLRDDYKLIIDGLHRKISVLKQSGVSEQALRRLKELKHL